MEGQSEWPPVRSVGERKQQSRRISHDVSECNHAKCLRTDGPSDPVPTAAGYRDRRESVISATAATLIRTLLLNTMAAGPDADGDVEMNRRIMQVQNKTIKEYADKILNQETKIDKIMSGFTGLSIRS